MTTRRYTEQQFRAAVDDPAVRTLADLCRALGLVPRGANYETLRAFADDRGIHLGHIVRRGPTTAATSGRGRRSYRDDQLRSALATARNYPELCELLGLRPVSGTYRRLRERAAALGLPIPVTWSRPGRLGPDGIPRRRQELRGEPPAARPTRRLRYDESALRQAVAAASSTGDVLRALGEVPNATTRRHVARDIHQLALDTSHFAAVSPTGGRQRRPLAELLVEGQRLTSGDLRKRLIEEQLKEHRCEGCRRTHWETRPIPLELDHVDGDRWNNRLVNLRLLCPNCHALTPTYRGRNIGRAHRRTDGSSHLSEEGA